MVYFLNQKSQCGFILEGLAMEDVGMYLYFMVIWSILRPLDIHILWPFGIFCGNLVYFVVIWYMLWPFGTFMVVWYIYGRLLYYSRFGKLHQEKSGKPAGLSAGQFQLVPLVQTIHQICEPCVMGTRPFGRRDGRIDSFGEHIG
jgi:hypothetical protein